MNIAKHDLQYSLLRLAQFSLWLTHHEQSDIHIRIFVDRLADGSDNPREVHDAWAECLADAEYHHRNIVPKINALRAEFGGKRIIDAPPSTPPE